MKNQIEAVLFISGKFMTANEIAKILAATPNKIIEEINQLKQNYKQKESSLEIQQVENRFKLNIKKEFSYITNKLLSDTDIDSPTTNTLAVIAYKAPVTQSEIIKIRGNKAYDHISQLKESSLISSEKQGRTRLLKLTTHFYDYFDTVEKEVKQVFEQIKTEQDLKE